MRAAIAIVADDLTGAADAAAGFLRDGRAVVVTWAAPDLPVGLIDRTDVLSVDAQTRELAPAAAAARTAHLVAGLRTAGVATLYKKMDSTLRGHIGEEVYATMTSWRPGSVAIVAPAFPRARRTTVNGFQRVDGVPLDRPAVAEILEGAGVATLHADLARVRGGSVVGLVRQCRRDRPVAVVCDAESDADLGLIAGAGAGCDRAVVWVGSGGLALAVARLHPGSGAPPSGPPAALGRPALLSSRGPVLIVVGSATEIATAQVDHTVAAGVRHLTFPVEDDPSAWTASGKALEACLRRGEDVVISARSGSGQTSALIEHDSRIATRLGELVRPFAGLVGGLVLTGGETATAVLRGCGTTGLRLVGEIEPGVPLSISVAPRPIPVVTKAGAFGHAATLTMARARLRESEQVPTPGTADGDEA